MRSIAPLFCARIPKMCDPYISHYSVTVTLAYMQKHLPRGVLVYALAASVLRKLNASGLGGLGERCLAAARGIFLEQTLLDGFVKLALGLAQGGSAWLGGEGLSAGLDGALGSNVALAASSRLLHAFDS